MQRAFPTDMLSQVMERTTMSEQERRRQKYLATF